MSRLYEQDFYAWPHEQAALLRAGRLDEAIAEAHRLAVIGAARETGFDEAMFPAACPFPVAAILDPAFWPGDGSG